MNTLWVFGDSFTFGLGCTPNFPVPDDGCSYYAKYYKNLYDVWPNLLGQMLVYDVKNLSKCGASNDMIVESVIDSFEFINQNDIVIIQKTLGNYEKTDIQWSDESNFKTKYRQFTSDKYKERQNKRFYFLKNQLLNKIDKVLIWDTDDKIVKSIQTISQHSKNEFGDFEHFSFIGHNQFANYIYNKLFDITDKKSII